MGVSFCFFALGSISGAVPLSHVPASALLCRHLYDYFTGNIRKNPQYKLTEVLQVVLLRQQSQYPKVCCPGSPLAAELDRAQDSCRRCGL